MATRYYETTCKSARVDGSIHTHVRRRPYIVKENHIDVTEEMRQKIQELHTLGVPATKIAKIVGVSAYRVRHIIND